MILFNCSGVTAAQSCAPTFSISRSRTWGVRSQIPPTLGGGSRSISLTVVTVCPARFQSRYSRTPVSRWGASGPVPSERRSRFSSRSRSRSSILFPTLPPPSGSRSSISPAVSPARITSPS